MPNIDKIANELKKSNKLIDGFLLSSEERKKIEDEFKAHKGKDKAELIKISKKQGICRYSVVRDENGQLFAIYNPAVDDQSKKKDYDKGAHAVVKVAQNLETGEFVAVKIQKVVKPKSGSKENKAELEQIAAEKRFLGKKKILKGYQRRLKQEKGNEYDKHYIFKKIIPGIQLIAPPSTKGTTLAKDYVYTKRLREQDYLDLFYNLLMCLQSLNQEAIIHRDLHGGNVLIDPDNGFSVEFIDWGTAVDADEKGYWKGPDHINPDFELNFSNGKDILDVLREFQEMTLPKEAHFEEIFGSPFFTKGSIYEVAGG